VRAVCLSFLVLAPAVALAASGAAPRPHVDPDAMREGRGDGPVSSARAIAHYLEAQRCQQVGDWRCAVAELDLAATYDERSPELRAALAEVLALTGQLARAEAEARRALQLSGDAGPAATRAHVLLAQLAAARDREQAVLELRVAVHNESDAAQAGQAPDPDPWRLLAGLYLELGDEQAADRTLDDLAARAPGESSAAREAGRWLLERHRAGRAEHYLRRAVQAAPDDVQAWRLLARAHQELGRTPEVKEDLQAILEAQPEDAEALFGLGTVALGEDDLGRARDLFLRYQRTAVERTEAAIQVTREWLDAGRPEDALGCVRSAEAETGAPPDARLRLWEGMALQRLRRWAEAAQVLRQVEATDGDAWVPARAALADVLARSGRLAAAGKALAGPLQEQPGEVRLLLIQASVLERGGRVRAAAASLERAATAHELAGEADDAAALRTARAGLLCRSGLAAEAVTGLEPAVVVRPRSAQLRVALAAALRASGAPERAAAELRALLVLDPAQPDALAALAGILVDLAQASPAAGERLDEAEGLARRAVELRPRSPEALDALGRVRSARGDHAGAVSALERAVTLSGREAGVLDDLGEAYRAAGRPREAAAAWRRALASAADEPPAVAERLRAALQRKLRGGGRAVAEHGPAAASPATP
jgi:Flp pilus assembly protein TadD